MKVGVLLPARLDDPGESLADARAMEAAGVDSIWLEEDDDSLDPWLRLAAIAAVTGTLRLGLIRRGSTSEPSARALETLQHLSRQRLITLIPSPSGGGQGGGISGTEHWQRVEVPADRDAWAATLERAQQNAAGVL